MRRYQQGDRGPERDCQVEMVRDDRNSVTVVTIQLVLNDEMLYHFQRGEAVNYRHRTR